MSRFTIPIRFVRRIPDPVSPHSERHILLCAISDLPKDLPTDPNPRNPRIDRPIWREIKKHLLNEEGEPNTFHLKNKGITLIAKSVNKIDDDKIELAFERGQGIVDGGHTYKLLIDNLGEIEDKNSVSNDDTSKISQFIKLEVLTGIAPDLWPEIARGLNTAIQVQEMSLMELQEEFAWIKDELQDQPYKGRIAYREGDDAPYDARDIIVLLDLFNVFEFPNEGAEHPVRAYTSKAQVLASYKAKQKQQYERLRPILKDILTLHDIIAYDGRAKQNAAGGKGGRLAFIEDRKRGQFEFVFTGKQSKYRLFDGALFPMLAAFRWMVTINPTTGLAEWRGGFAAVKDLWNKTGSELMRATQGTSDELGRKPYAIGRSRNHWVSLHKTVANADLVQRTQA